VKENNKLHTEIIECKEKLATNENTWRADVRKLEDERDDMKVVAAQKDFKISQLEKENNDLKIRL